MKMTANVPVPVETTYALVELTESEVAFIQLLASYYVSESDGVESVKAAQRLVEKLGAKQLSRTYKELFQ